MMVSFLEFFSLADPNIRIVLLGILLFTTTTAMVGTFSVLQKKALVGDAIAHAALPGVCLAFMATGTKAPLPLLAGAFVSGWISLWLIEQISQRSKLSYDTALTLVLSSTFGLGLLLLTTIQHSGNIEQVGLNNFLFGKAAALLSSDLYLFALLCLTIIITLLLFFKELSLLAFDRTFAETLGLPVQRLDLLLTTLTVLTIVISIRAVGILLIAAMLITPAAAARFWTHRLSAMLFIAVMLAALAGLLGTFISYLTPAMPTGPWIVLAISLMAYVSFLLAPQSGLLARKLREYRHQQKTLLENILKMLYELGVQENNFYAYRTAETLRQHRPLALPALLQGLKLLKRRSMVLYVEGSWCLTPRGKERGAQISQRHELWELYLKRYLKVQPDHVHADAESIEHILTPALVEELKQLMR